MAEPPVKAPRSRLTPSGARLILATFAAAFGALFLVLPKPVTPHELPPLRLDDGAFAEVRAESARLAGQAPEGGVADRLRALYAAQGRAEVGQGESQEAFAARERQIRGAVATLRQQQGPDAIAALRAEAMQQLEPALAGELEQETEEEVLGSFPRMLDRYHASEGGRIVAPAPVVWALFRARWNGIHRRPLTEGFAPVELQAYHGWLALEVHDAPLDRRAAALRAFAEAGGAGAREAEAIFAMREGRMMDAAAIFGELYAETGDLRMRNHALAAQRRAY
ncbi:MAG TPA: hypothetical protein RMH85_08975 [Polyangiaceae bacterium LLY-WYZ-15_(1-7)]|nr:hypothetical protein [Sandaracinus sp.]HJL01577.1 hypothetical protein [Polyangiaceae bacterium LLY-WYZ-15_(1-7)]HJL08617.1 hypothetical protein [Polyangiaceae bacterium LLY-WYZ-15_(1-7)]HJL37327.1 hypothetical protein [Polyangiaceae bacterium LLY-WYZ-15_(1-7)]HJL49229.1 hypothetical protein [Polyangiaceae bacterium LLY-WYZ-15_(1-7)]